MLTCSFIHAPGIGRVTERKLWDAGVRSWEDFLADPARAPIGRAQRERVCRTLERSREALKHKDWEFFHRSLPSSEQWRMLNLPQARTAYMDIETTGLGPGYDYVTCIAVYDGAHAHSYVRGKNLDQFARDIEQYDVLVTYNGKCFDVPFIRAAMGVDLRMPHVDLRYVCASVGFKGGLKGAEKLAGVARDDDLAGVDGWVAVMLWSEYERTGNRKALDTLIAYNTEDAVNLLPLSQATWNRKLPPCFAALRTEVSRQRPTTAFRPDRRLLRRLLGHAGLGSW